MKHLCFFPLVFLFLSSCQGVKKLDCSEVNWREQGQESATLGVQKEEALLQMVKLCKQKAFNDGYEDGIRLFCKTKVGLKVGKSGDTYNNICPKETELFFLRGYINGRILYLKNQLDLSKGDYINAKDRFWRKEQEYLLIKSEDPEEAKMQRDFLEAYQEESNQLKESVDALKKELSYLRRKKEELKFN